VAQWIDECVTIIEPQGDTESIIPFRLWPAQARLLGDLQHERQIIILKARQLGITWLVLAYAMWLCLFRDNRTVIIISKDLGSANESIRRVRGMFTRLKDKPAALTVDNTSEIGWSNDSRIKAFASSSDAGSSFTGSLLILDELAKNPNADSVYTSAKPTIDDGGRAIILSTAKGTNNIFARQWENAEAGINSFKPIFIPWNERPGRDAQWYAGVASSALSMAHHMQEYPATSKEAFQSLADSPFLDAMEWWDACKESLPALGKREPIVVALDAATSNDSFGLVAVSRHPSRPSDIAVRFVHEWRPVNGLIRFGTADEPETPRGVVERLINDYNVNQLTGDPYQLHDLFQSIKEQGRIKVKPFPQGGERLEADNQLKRLIIEKRIAHDGDKTLRRHIENADAKIDDEAHKLRLLKRHSDLKIDCAVCCSMAAKRCLDLSY
jgi:phage terminase large subunit-like protein